MVDAEGNRSPILNRRAVPPTRPGVAPTKSGWITLPANSSWVRSASGYVLEMGTANPSGGCGWKGPKPVPRAVISSARRAAPGCSESQVNRSGEGRSNRGAQRSVEKHSGRVALDREDAGGVRLGLFGQRVRSSQSTENLSQHWRRRTPRLESPDPRWTTIETPSPCPSDQPAAGMMLSVCLLPCGHRNVAALVNDCPST